jgi:methyl-accepting chemotaxis protein
MSARPMKLSTRLMLAFGSVVLLCVLSSSIALLKLREVQDGLEGIVTDGNVKLELSNDMMDANHVVTRAMRNLALLSDEAAMKLENQKIAATRTHYDEAREKLVRITLSDEGRARIAAVDAARAEAKPLNDKVIELGLANKMEEATRLLMAQAAPATERWQDALRANLAAQKQRNAARYDESETDYATARTLLISIAGAAALISAVLALLIVRSIVGAVGGEPAEVAELARAIADADLSRRVAVRDGDDRSIVAAMARMQHALSELVGRVRGSAEGVATASSQIAQGNADLSQRTEEQASALEQTAATMEQLGSTVRLNADNARQASQLAQGASEVAGAGGEVVGRVVGTMKGIQDSSQKIGEIISVIDGIAFQTNILALNAAVEAARAGEQGRGFAVVASEVRSLAQRSAEAARQVKTLITDSIEQVDRGSLLVDEAGRTMKDIVTSVKRVSDIVAEISAATAEQSTGIAQVGEAVSQMDQVTQQNAALVEQSAAAAESLKVQAGDMVTAVGVFRLAA